MRPAYIGARWMFARMIAASYPGGVCWVELQDLATLPAVVARLAQRLGVPMERVYLNLQRYGNVSAASVAIALDEANRTERMKEGDYILLVVFGGGLTWASSVIQW